MTEKQMDQWNIKILQYSNKVKRSFYKNNKIHILLFNTNKKLKSIISIEENGFYKKINI